MASGGQIKARTKSNKKAFPSPWRNRVVSFAFASRRNEIGASFLVAYPEPPVLPAQLLADSIAVTILKLAFLLPARVFLAKALLLCQT